MANATHENCLSLATLVRAVIAGQELEIHVLATSVQELRDTVAGLTGQELEIHLQTAGVQELRDTVTELTNITPAATAPEPAQPDPTQAAPAATPSAQPAPSAPAAAQPTAATPSATPTAEPSSPAPATAAVTLPDVLAPARELLQRPNGEDTLRDILGSVGAQNISTADPAQYGNIKAAIEQALGA